MPTPAGRAPDATRIDQVVYVWSRQPRTGMQGFFPVASSLGSPAARSWDGLPASHLLAENASTTDAMASLAYVTGPAEPGAVVLDPASGLAPERAALVHRVRVPRRSGTGPGRLRAHVLTGRADQLTERVALALHAAGAGRAEAPRASTRLTPLHLPDLTATRRIGERALRQAARVPSRRHRLTNVIAAVLTSSGAGHPFAISHTGNEEAVTLMWALIELLEEVLPYRLTFVSRMTSALARDGRPDRHPPELGPAEPAEPAEPIERISAPTAGPRFQFALRPPRSEPGSSRAMIHVDPRLPPRTAPIIQTAAGVLTTVYSHSGMRGIAGLLAVVGPEPFDVDEPARWSHRLVMAARTPTALPPPPDRTIPPPAAAPWSDPPAERPDSAAQTVGVDERHNPPVQAVGAYVRDAYTRLLARPETGDGAATGSGEPDPTRRLITVLTAPVGLPPDLPGAERLRGQLRRLAGLLHRPVADDRSSSRRASPSGVWLSTRKWPPQDSSR
ncbi:hypothetical protein ND747_12700, partial [Frankia sp. R82]|nr:hypothetical protein [Frankia sp. R82]